MVTLSSAIAAQEPTGSIRGVVYDRDFNAPLPLANVLIVETNRRTKTGERGNYLLSELAPGRYTLVFSKPGYVRQLESDVVVGQGTMADIDVWLSGDFTEMEEFVVQDLLASGAGTESALLQLRFDSPALLDSISADFMSRAGASDAASALKLVSGATVSEGKFAVVRGLPDRYVASLMNGVRLPSADEDKRAVEFDQFPAGVLESIRVSKTFTPDMQGDASGGAVDVRLKGIPDERVLQLKLQTTYESEASGHGHFLSYDGGGVGAFGLDDGKRDQQLGLLGGNWGGAVGTSLTEAPLIGKLSFDVGGKRLVSGDDVLGGFVSVFYERDAAYSDDGIDDSYWVVNPGDPLTPETIQGTPEDGDFKTALFDVTQGTQQVQWGGLALLGYETDLTELGLTFLFTHTAEDAATLAEDTRGKEYFFPGYDPDDPLGFGHGPDDINSAPYLRLQTLEYTERTTGTLQLAGDHEFEGDGFEAVGLDFGTPRLDWTVAASFANLNQPDKRQFGSLWLPESFNPGAPPIVPPFTTPDTYFPFKPSANFNLGNLQRIWKTIEEESKQASLNVELPFEQWSDQEGYVKAGLFRDAVERRFDQDTFSNFGDSSASYLGSWDMFWSDVFPFENHPVTASTEDVDYDGTIDITAWYGMVDLPLSEELTLVGGARLESTDISVRNIPEVDARWFPPGATGPVTLNPGDADVSFSREHVLPSIGLVYEPTDAVTVRTSFSRTVGRQTFKEVTPIIQQEFLGGPIFIGNPGLGMSTLNNVDLRVDYKPEEGSLLSASWFYKDIKDPIEYVQRLVDFTFTTARNYPKGRINGFEFEARQDLGLFHDPLEGVSVGANATLIDSVVKLPEDEVQNFSDPSIDAPMSQRDMTNAPEHLYNLYATWDIADTGTRLALFYTVKGDTLVAGAGEANGNFVPNIYAKELGTLNFSVSQTLSEKLSATFKIKNITNPRIEEVYRSEYTSGDVTRSSYTRGIEFSFGISLIL